MSKEETSMKLEDLTEEEIRARRADARAAVHARRSAGVHATEDGPPTWVEGPREHASEWFDRISDQSEATSAHEQMEASLRSELAAAIKEHGDEAVLAAVGLQSSGFLEGIVAGHDVYDRVYDLKSVTERIREGLCRLRETGSARSRLRGAAA